MSAVCSVSDLTTPTPYCGWRTFIPIWSVSMFMLLSKPAILSPKAQCWCSSSSPFRACPSQFPLAPLIDSILPAVRLRPMLRIVYVAPLPRAPFIRSRSLSRQACPSNSLHSHWLHRSNQKMAENQILAWKIVDHQSWPALSAGDIGPRKRYDHDFAGYRSDHAASSCGEFQSSARTDSLSSAPLNASSRAFFFRRIV